MGLWIKVGGLKAMSSNFADSLLLRNYYKSDEWITRRNEYLESVDHKSEMSGIQTNLVHHLKYPNIKDKDSWGTELDRHLMAVTDDEHKLIHTKFSKDKKFKWKLIDNFKSI